ncbi:MAG: class I SAM-dependent methyltransferase [Deltaproteobacteria bacterium]|nr:class I SAM-dependent methyltransferase [Deltaproteobacteria bacterium]
MNNISLRQSHAALGMRSRQAKARKIEAILSTKLKLTDARVLDVGAGSGIIANHMSQCVGPGGEVVAVDVMDQRRIRRGFRFVRVTDRWLPFEDVSFDVVISNHVMEHVGKRQAQLHHLREFRRVLKDEGWGYFAVPNQWRLIEPHFKLPLLSWFPLGLRSAYVRMASRGKVYDVFPPSHYEL